MTTSLIVLTAILILTILACIYLLVRNQKVFEFRRSIIELCHEYNLSHLGTKQSPYNWFLDKYSYGQMMLSIKPLRLEVWYSPEEIQEILSQPNK